jgi:hypothetical protein
MLACLSEWWEPNQEFRQRPSDSTRAHDGCPRIYLCVATRPDASLTPASTPSVGATEDIITRARIRAASSYAVNIRGPSLALLHRGAKKNY